MVIGSFVFEHGDVFVVGALNDEVSLFIEKQLKRVDAIAGNPGNNSKLTTLLRHATTCPLNQLMRD